MVVGIILDTRLRNPWDAYWQMLIWPIPLKEWWTIGVAEALWVFPTLFWRCTMELKCFDKLWDAHMSTLTPQQKIEFMIDQLNRIADFPPGQGWVASRKESP